MRLPACFCASLLLVVLFASGSSSASAQTSDSPAGGVQVSSISGRVTIGSRPATRIKLVLALSDIQQIGPTVPLNVVRRTMTSGNGKYTFTGLKPGGYVVIPVALTSVLSGEAFFSRGGRSVTVDPAMQISGIDFALEPGGVITGRVVDAGGSPVIGEPVRLEQLDERRNGSSYWARGSSSTDDRGVYRIYGIGTGRYRVSVGGTDSSATGRKHYLTTYSPHATDSSAAAVVEVSAGAEASGVDITVGNPVRTYVAEGSVVDADTGTQLRVAGRLTYARGQSIVYPDQKNIEVYSDGEFKLLDLTPAHYTIRFNASDKDYYADPTVFDITDSDVTGLKLMVHRAASISGVVTLESPPDPDRLSRVANPLIQVLTESSERGSGSGAASVLPDGGFRVTGLPPGRVYFYTGGGLADGYSIERIELNGTPESDLKIAEGESLIGVHIALSYSTGSIQGVVKVAGGMPPTGGLLFIRAVRTDDPNGRVFMEPTDSVGRFRINGLPDGDYLLSVFGSIFGKSLLRIKPIEQKVTIGGGQAADVTLKVELEPQGPASDFH